jgi:hypothetical protein
MSNLLCWGVLDSKSRCYSITGGRRNLKRVDDGAEVVIDDGDENILAEQVIEFTDVPLDEVTLFACWTGEY